jgi:hypothetical protein
MAYKGGVRDCNTILDGHIPLWLMVHEAGHLITRIQLTAAWNLAGLDNPSTFESIRVWLDEAIEACELRSVACEALGCGHQLPSNICGLTINFTAHSI